MVLPTIFGGVMKKKKDSDWIVEGLIKKNAINIMNVAHDDWCDLLKDRAKECNCDPEVKMEVHQDSVWKKNSE